MRPSTPHALIAVTLALAGCATRTPDAQWTDPQLAAHALQGARVLVACEASEPVLRQLCQDRLAEELVARGLVPVKAVATLPPSTTGAAAGEAQLAAARIAGAQAVLVAHVAPETARATGYGPGLSVGLGGWSGGHVGAGVGISVPIGGGGSALVDAGHAANASFSDARSGRLLWTARASSAVSDLNARMGELARTLLGAAEKAGLF